VDEKQAEISERIAELREFAAQLTEVRATLASSPPPRACRTDLSCCLPSGGVGPVELQLTGPGEGPLGSG
jgi:hypothetical protein